MFKSRVLQQRTTSTQLAICFTMIILSAFFFSTDAYGQNVDATSGKPFGVAHCVLLLPDADSELLAKRDGLRFVDESQRVLYPASVMGEFGNNASAFLGTDIAIDSRLHVSFLFRGDEPFRIRITSPVQTTLTVRPTVKRPRQYTRELNKWWRRYCDQARTRIEQSDYPPLVESYLVEMLAKRLGLQKPLVDRRRDSQQSQFSETVQMLFGMEELRYANLKNLLQGRSPINEPQSISLPEPIPLRQVGVKAVTEDVEIEPIAFHVPEECFYVRLGSFENYLWLDELKNEFGGDLSRMVTRRGHNAKLEERALKQLAFRTSATSKQFGSQFVEDIAVIGRDLYLQEGAAIGVLIQAKNSFAISTSFVADRAAVLAAEKKNGATLKTVNIAGKNVSLLSTPDHHIRSFYATSGAYHLITSSRVIAQRFLECTQQKNSLGDSPEFLNARISLPLSRNDKIFAYFSSRFFGELLSPHYQIELYRRMQRKNATIAVELAMLAAKSEDMAHANVEELVRGGFLPTTFLNVQDFPKQTRFGVKPQTPITDVEIQNISQSELDYYSRIQSFHVAHWREMDPLMVGVQSIPLDGTSVERIVIDGNVSPLSEEKYGWLLSMVGPATDVEIKTDPSDVVKLQMSLQGGLLWPDIPAHHLFLTIRDSASPVDLVPTGYFQTWQLLRTTPGMLGSWPELGLMNLISFLQTPTDINGFSQLPLGIWRWQGRGFSAVSFHRDIIAAGANHLDAQPSKNIAQFRLRVGHLAKSQLSSWANWAHFSQAYQLSTANVRLLHTLNQQLRIPISEAKQIAESLLQTELVCALDGDYKLVEQASGSQWISTNWPEESKVPQTFRSPFVEWMQQARIDFSKLNDRMVMHAEIDMLRREKPTKKKKSVFDSVFDGGDQ